jgi:hypothetical protein
MYGATGKFYNSDKLAPSKLSEVSEGVRSFIQSIEDDSDLRWGGNFSNTDPVHIDDHLNASMSAWEAV